jgi:hypothetical protein
VKKLASRCASKLLSNAPYPPLTPTTFSLNPLYKAQPNS